MYGSVCFSVSHQYISQLLMHTCAVCRIIHFPIYICTSFSLFSPNSLGSAICFQTVSLFLSLSLILCS